MLENKSADKSELRFILFVGVLFIASPSSDTELASLGAQSDKNPHSPSRCVVPLLKSHRFVMLHSTNWNKRIQEIIENTRTRLGWRGRMWICFAREVDKFDFRAIVR